MDWNLLFTVFFGLGLMIIYLPQYWKIFKMKSSHGFHQLFMFMGHTASFLSCLNSLIFYINNWWNCHGSLECTESFFGFGLIVFQWLLFWIFYWMYIVYHPQDRDDLNRGSGCCGCAEVLQTRKMAIIFFIVSHVMMVIGLIVTLIILGTAGWHESDTNPGLMVWSGILELTILVMFLAHYLPQIYETYRLQHIGSLSLITLGMMCPGTFLWTAYLAFQPSLTNNGDSGGSGDSGESGNSGGSGYGVGPHQIETGLMKSQVMVWLPYLIVGIMQFVLLIIGIYYERLRKKRNRFFLSLDIEDDVQDQTLIDDRFIVNVPITRHQIQSDSLVSDSLLINDDSNWD